MADAVSEETGQKNWRAGAIAHDLTAMFEEQMF